MSEKPLWRMIAGRKAGPYEPAKLRPLVKDGRISLLDRFSYDGTQWRPASDFPELMRAPPAPIEDPLEEDLQGDATPFSGTGGAADGTDVFGPSPGFTPRLPTPESSPADDARLIKAIYFLIAFGAGMFVLLIGYIVIASLMSDGRPEAAAASRPAAKTPAAGARSPRRLHERAGGFSYDPPSGWQIMSFPGQKFRISHGPRENGFAANINVVEEDFEGTLADYTELNLANIKQLFAGLTVLDRMELETDDGQPMLAIVTENQQQDRTLRQSFFFVGRGGKKFVLTCSALADGGENLDATFVKAMKTFRLH